MIDYIFNFKGLCRRIRGWIKLASATPHCNDTGDRSLGSLPLELVHTNIYYQYPFLNSVSESKQLLSRWVAVLIVMWTLVSQQIILSSYQTDIYKCLSTAMSAS